MEVIAIFSVIAFFALLYFPFYFLISLFGDLGMQIYGFGFIPCLVAGIVYFFVRTETYLIEFLKSRIKLKKFDVLLKN